MEVSKMRQFGRRNDSFMCVCAHVSCVCACVSTYITLFSDGMFPTSLTQAPQASVSLHYQWYWYHSPPQWRQPQPGCSPLDWLPLWTYLHHHKRQDWFWKGEAGTLSWELALEVGMSLRIIFSALPIFRFYCPILQRSTYYYQFCLSRPAGQKTMATLLWMRRTN